MAHSHRSSNRPVLARVGTLVAGCSIALALAFFGLIAVATGGTAGTEARLPFYVLAAAVTFAAALVGLDRRARNGRNLLVVALAIALGSFVLVSLGVEGAAYGVQQPAEALSPDRLMYLLAAAMVSTGLGYWALNHWRELASSVRR